MFIRNISVTKGSRAKLVRLCYIWQSVAQCID